MNVIRNITVQDPLIWKRAPQPVLRKRPWSACAWQAQLRHDELLRDIIVIDAHAHLGRSVRFHTNKPEAASMVEVMDRIGVQATIVTANPSLRAEPEYGNQLVLQAVRQCPGRILGYVTANPFFAKDLAATLNRYLDEPGIIGIKLHPELHDDYPLLGPRYEPMWEIASRRRVPVLFHTYFGGDRAEDIAVVAEKYPQVPLLVGHALQDKSFEGMVELANSFPNVYSDMTVPEIFGVTEFFVEALDDIRKLVFGSDYPPGNCHFRLGAIIYSRISIEAKRKILGENMAGLLGIELSSLGNNPSPCRRNEHPSGSHTRGDLVKDRWVRRGET